MKLFLIYCAIIALAALVTWILYAVDKSRAKRGEWRIPEATLLCFSFFGGAIGGYFAMFSVRHKTKHWYFHLINILGIIWQLALLIFLLVRAVR